jgi:hypothetical protein
MLAQQYFRKMNVAETQKKPMSETLWQGENYLNRLS